MKRGGGINFKGLFGGLGKGRRGKGKREGEERGGPYLICQVRGWVIELEDEVIHQ